MMKACTFKTSIANDDEAIDIQLKFIESVCYHSKYKTCIKMINGTSYIVIGSHNEIREKLGIEIEMTEKDYIERKGPGAGLASSP